MVGGLKSRTRPYYSRRCKNVSSTNIESLPDELLFDILVRLQADDIYERARVVCRRWYHIIHADAFINTHLHHSTYGLLVPEHGLLCSHLIYLSATEQGQIEIFDSSWKCRSTAWGSCNGLVLMLNTKWTSLYILNPATRQTFLLPPFELDSKLVHGVCGIAYSAASIEYKVVQSTIIEREPRVMHLNVLPVGVDNSWRHVQVEHLPHDFRESLGCTPLITEGFMHWAWDTEKVLTLNVETEIVTESVAPLPQTNEDMVYLSTGRYLTLFICHLDLT
ncbi:hypothetical protein C2S53_001317 [Perilla frutescens var. hirtella]|uniref:F-box domain-containing protein n=1 Tax=Perilla frutescens var. hirtella TaxID=608512 RepID=A0AAD4JA57_PERFH|nr:hypothetical protein C2S53_001317 [Perilla frutescens var. hirtella]